MIFIKSKASERELLSHISTLSEMYVAKILFIYYPHPRSDMICIIFLPHPQGLLLSRCRSTIKNDIVKRELFGHALQKNSRVLKHKICFMCSCDGRKYMLQQKEAAAEKNSLKISMDHPRLLFIPHIYIQYCCRLRHCRQFCVICEEEVRERGWHTCMHRDCCLNINFMPSP